MKYRHPSYSGDGNAFFTLGGEDLSLEVKKGVIDLTKLKKELQAPAVRYFLSQGYVFANEETPAVKPEPKKTEKSKDSDEE